MDFSSYTRLFTLFMLMPLTMAATIRQMIDQKDTVVQVRNILSQTMRELLMEPGPFTMFVPADEAFEPGRMPQQQRSRLLSPSASKNTAENQFLYHIINGRLSASMLQDNRRKTRALNAPYLYIRRMPDGELYVNGARIIERDIEADNGVIHIIDTFLAQPESPGNGVPLSESALGYMYGTAQQMSNDKLRTKRFTELLDTYKKEFPNRATEVLNAEEMTLFLPSDDSLRDFTTSNIAGIKQDLRVLQGLVERHIIHRCSGADTTGECDKDNVYHTGILRDLAKKEETQKLSAMMGEISPTVFNNQLYVGNDCGGNQVIWGNITVQNGVIHMIDGFLGFRQRNVLSYLKTNNQLRTFSDLAQGAPTYINNKLNMGSGAEDVPLSQRVTVFAPTESAMSDYRLTTEEERERHIRYHVLEGELPVKDMLNGTVKTMFRGDSPSDPTITAKFTQLPNGDTYVTVDHVRARIIRPNVCVKNGLVHIIDNILGVPLYNIYRFIEIEPLLDVLYRQLSYTGYKQELNSEVENKYFTFFAPVNHAMELMRLTKVGKKYLDPLQIAERGPSVLYGRHITSGELYIDELTERTTEVETFATKNMGRPGNNFKIVCNGRDPCYIEFEGGKMTFNRTDIKMINGVVHLINEVIYTDNSVRESELISSAPVHHSSMSLYLIITAIFLLILV